jgi:2-oxo-4-hydroxy-4-carboxy--5-ureidoimidazoline (OHCU) decarboxylase
MRFLAILAFLMTNLVFNGEAQRIKYKNLFPILQSKDYKTAEPQLLTFLEENNDEANAYFYLGEIIVSKLDSVEIFPTTEKYDSMINKAIAAYKKSIELVDDREVRKNDEYYAAYNRRDLRTGKFGIKKSDIHLDYENKIKAASKKKETVANLHELKEKSIQEFEQLTKEVSQLYESYSDESSFLLRSNDASRKTLKEVEDSYTNFKTTYQDFVDQLSSLNHPAYNPALNFVEITSWEGLKPLQADFTDFSIKIQDYAKYFDDLVKEIEEEVNPLKELLYKTDAELTESISTIREATDSLNFKNVIISEELKNGLNTYDDSQVILNLLKYKKRKSRSEFLSNKSLFPILVDSTNVYQRANLVEGYKDNLAAQYELIESIGQNLNERIINDFKLFLDSFEPSIQSYIETEKTVLKQKLDSVSQRSEFMARQIQFFNHGKDSIYLTPLIAATHNSSKYVIKTIELDSMLLIGGVFDNTPFLASAGFDMSIIDFKLYEDTTLSISNMLLLNENLLVNFDSDLEEEEQQFIEYLSPDLNQIWTFEYQSSSTLGKAKVEAGIFFLYDQEGQVLNTLNSQGEVIGN